MPSGIAQGTVLSAPSVSGDPRSARIAGLDIARGLAILGMFIAHIIRPEEAVSADPDTWIGLVNGRSAALFAVLAGFSLALLSGRGTPPEGEAVLRMRLRIGARALVIFALGGILSLGDHGIAVILEYYAIAFLLVLPIIRWQVRNLLILAGVLAVLAPIAQVGIALFIQDNGGGTSALALLMIFGYYPALIWVVFMIVGLAVARWLFAGGISGSSLGLIALVGAGLAILGYGGASVFAQITGIEQGEVFVGYPQWANLLGAAPHSGSTFELLGASGIALLIIAAALALPRWAQRALWPLAATGRMALTAYAVHLIALVILVSTEVDRTDPVAQTWWFVLVTLIGCSAWILLFRQGPLEKLVSFCSRAAASVPGPARTTQ
ncbi:heparan-alpha-glucosaminide N-acetyltransferase domain-containing protein [Mycetocola sp. JXN-3]|uniref:heparan-alpha-glucosaminide N-acetyltransferase domain-containing protein n=1 Tax=Mycetocola sp. JXN-3 TaxID=2116510 RepID=UPI00165D254D|nr:heparan-alpha-glucosaminide N-acetyltransferase domain-containing protein [Mycetocola sp. JXN-3]